jgi:hypothetical protein
VILPDLGRGFLASVAGTNKSDRKRGKVMRRRLLPLTIATVLACVTAGTGLAAGSTEVEHLSGTFPDKRLRLQERPPFTARRSSATRATARSSRAAPWFGVFTADNGKSATLSFAGPSKQTSPPVIDEQAGTVTIMTTYLGVFEKLSITRGPTFDS